MKNVVRIVLYCVMGVYAVLGFARLTEDAFAVSASPVAVINATAALVETQARNDSGFLVKTVGGKIAVEDSNTGKIVQTTDTRVSSLPEKDRALLRSGIKQI